MITEVFVSLDGFNYAKLDLEKDESIPMRYTFKDTQDISKTFTPYSLNFTFEATPKNLRALGHFGNTEVIKPQDFRKLKCKVYVNSILNQFGLLKLEKIVYKMGKPSVVTASFATKMTSLKDKIADDTIDLLDSALVGWLPNDIYNRLQSIQSINVSGIDLKYFVPLASTNRVLQYNDNDLTTLDNIAYNPIATPLSNNVIKGSELRPAISLSTIIDLIKVKYNLQIVSPLEIRPEYKDAFIWCMGEDVKKEVDDKFILKLNLGALSYRNDVFGAFIPSPKKYTISGLTSNSSFKIVRVLDNTGWDKFVTQKITLQNINYLGNEANTTATVKIFRIGDATPIITNTFTLEGTTVDLVVQIADAFLIGDELEYYTYIQFNQPLTWTNSKIDLSFKYKIGAVKATFFRKSDINNNNIEMGGSKIDLIKALPNIKVIDLLTSYFKSFNIASLDVTPNDDSLYWYTPQDIEATKKIETYSVDLATVEKSVQDDYNYYTFQHAESNFRSNVDYKIAAGIDYAKTAYPEVRPRDAKVYKVETNFTLIPPVMVVGTDDIVTYYGFESGSPEILGTGEARYTPNFGELVLFYSHGNKPLNRNFGVQNNVVGGALVTSAISSYIKVLPYTVDLKSFAWSVLVIADLAIKKSLFNRYYADIISRYVSQNVMKHDFTLTLSPNEVRDFRLENDIIIGENKFTVIDSTIDITTGKTKLTLLNY